MLTIDIFKQYLKYKICTMTLPLTCYFSAVYLALTLVLGVFCVVGSVIVIRLHFRDEETPVPNWLRKITTCCCIPFSCWRECCKKNSIANKDSDEVKSFSLESGDHALNWKEVSAILDWFCFVVFLLVTTLVTVAFTVLLLVGGFA